LQQREHALSYATPGSQGNEFQENYDQENRPLATNAGTDSGTITRWPINVGVINFRIMNQAPAQSDYARETSFDVASAGVSDPATNTPPVWCRASKSGLEINLPQWSAPVADAFPPRHRWPAPAARPRTWRTRSSS